MFIHVFRNMPMKDLPRLHSDCPARRCVRKYGQRQLRIRCRKQLSSPSSSGVRWDTQFLAGSAASRGALCVSEGRQPKKRQQIKEKVSN